MREKIFKIFSLIFRHKFIAVVIFVIIVAGGYFGYKSFFQKEGEIRYITTAVKKGTLIVSVSGSGQVSPLEQVDVKPRVSGEVIAVYVSKDQKIKAGQLLVELNSENAKKAVRDAEINLENARYSLEKIKNSHQEAEADLKETYEDVFKSISDAFNELPDVIKQTEEMFIESSYKEEQADIDYYRSLIGTYTGHSFVPQEKENSFIRWRNKYNLIRGEYLVISKSSSPEILEDFLGKTCDIVKEVSDLIRSARDIVVLYLEILADQSLTPPVPITTTNAQLSVLNSLTNSLSQQATILFSGLKIIAQNKKTIENYKKEIQSQEFTIEQKENVLLDAKEELAEHFIRAPFDGLIAKISVKRGDSVSSGTIIATLITHQKIAEISFNEIDAAKIKVGQKATLGLDALPELTITGKVIEVDTVGTVSQGVVSYGVKLVLDSDDERIKPGMSVAVEIITDIRQDVLLVANSAVKQQGESSYVEVMVNNTPQRQVVETGLSNDNSCEIVSGLKEGDIVVTSTISSNNTQTTQTRSTQGVGAPPGGQIQMFFR